MPALLYFKLDSGFSPAGYYHFGKVPVPIWKKYMLLFFKVIIYIFINILTTCHCIFSCVGAYPALCDWQGNCLFLPKAWIPPNFRLKVQNRCPSKCVQNTLFLPNSPASLSVLFIYYLIVTSFKCLCCCPSAPVSTVLSHLSSSLYFAFCLMFVFPSKLLYLNNRSVCRLPCQRIWKCI